MENEMNLHDHWQKYLHDEITAPYFKAIIDRVSNEYNNSICYPPKNLIFSALNATLPQDVKIIIIGQDPYHGSGEANGLAFSVNDGIKIPPSLRNIYKEVSLNFETIFTPQSGNLTCWAQQGVLLLNSTLTVKKDNANSHKHIGWQEFTNRVLQKLANDNEHLVFMLWGNFACQKSKFIDNHKHLILKSGHPSPMSANQGKWFGNMHFKKANTYLRSNNKTEIDWH